MWRRGKSRSTRGCGGCGNGKDNSGAHAAPLLLLLLLLLLALVPVPVLALASPGSARWPLGEGRKDARRRPPRPRTLYYKIR